MDEDWYIEGANATEKCSYALPHSEQTGNQDDIDLATFGKRQQLKVYTPSVIFNTTPLISFCSETSAFISMIGLTCTLMATWEGLFS